MSRAGVWKAAFLATLGLVNARARPPGGNAPAHRTGPGRKALFTVWRKVQGGAWRREWARRQHAHGHERARARLRRQIEAGRHDPWLARCARLDAAREGAP